MENFNREEILNLESFPLGKKYDFTNAKTLGSGGSGIVYLANQIFDNKGNQQLSKKRAVKFFIYREDLIEKLGLVSISNFNTEMVNISNLDHQNILKVIDVGNYKVNIENEEKTIPYTITEFIDGPTFETLFENDYIDFAKAHIRNEEIIFSLFEQLLNAIDYLHNKHFYHCDIAPKNIFLKVEENNLVAILGDLGAGNFIHPEFTTTKVIGTKKYMTKEAISKKDKDIPYGEFCQLQPMWDIYSTVITLKEIIGKLKNSDYLEFDTWSLDRLYEKLDETEFDTISSIIKCVNNLRPSSNQILKLDELSEASRNILEILIPINSVFITKRMKKIADHDIMLRLKNVSQLSEGDMTFPGANHTRYEHSLGTYELMRKAMIALLRNKDYAKYMSEKNVIIGLISALLSSVNYFPYSYIITELNSQQSDLFNDLAPIKAFERFFEKKSDITGLSISDLINKEFNQYNVTIDELEYVIFGKKIGQPRNRDLEILHLLLNSSIGVRVVDYIMRDSHHIGLTYKVNVGDLFKALAISDGEFCLKQQGILSAEQIVANRYWLYKRIYWCDPNRAYTALAKHVFYLVGQTNFQSELLENLYNITKQDINSLILKNADGSNSKTIERSILQLSRMGQSRYRSVLVLDNNANHAHASSICVSFKQLDYAKQHNIRDQLEESFCQRYSEYIKEPIRDSGALLLIDMPYNKTHSKLGNDFRVLRYDQSYIEPSKTSGVISGLESTFDEQLLLLRVYLRPDIYDKLIGEGKVTREQIETFLCDKLYEIL